MTSSIRHALSQLGNPLEWSSATKSALLVGIVALLQLQYLLWLEFLLHTPVAWSHIDVPYLRTQLPVFRWLLGCSVVLTLAFPFCRRLFGDRVLYEYLATLYYGLSLCYYGYLIGTLSIAVGVVLAAAPVVGFIMFHRGAVLVSFVAAVTVNVVLVWLAAENLILYAPGFVSFQDSNQASVFWAGSMVMFTTPHLVVLLVLAAFVLGRWREREEQVRLLSLTDALTGLANRGHIVDALERQLAEARRHGRPLAAVMVDLDYFKQINDQHGHLVGDEVLRQAAIVLNGHVRRNDMVGRYGGEEFLMVLPDAGLALAEAVAERCRRALERITVETGIGKPLRISGSFGVCAVEHEYVHDADALLRHADEALYAAKAGGRNRVCTARIAPAREAPAAGPGAPAHAAPPHA